MTTTPDTQLTSWWRLATTFFVVFVGLGVWINFDLLTGLPRPWERLALETPPWNELLRQRGLETFTYLWILYLGAAIGSFLNVVVWRMPRGESIVHTPSHCPRCEHPIRWHDNVPVLGWLRLHGRCRDCHAPIAARYAWVELSVGLIFLGFFLGETLSGGRNLPFQRALAATGWSWILSGEHLDLLLLGLYHAVGLSLLLTLALIDADGQRIPRRLIGCSVLLAVLAPLVWTPTPMSTSLHGLHPVLWSGRDPSWLHRALTGLLGTATGIVLGRLVDRPGRDHQATPSLALVGALVGWQATVAIAGWTMLIALAGARLLGRRSSANRSIPWIIFGVTIGQLALWRTTTGWTWWPGASTPPMCWAATFGVVAGLVWLARNAIPSTSARAAESAERNLA